MRWASDGAGQPARPQGLRRAAVQRGASPVGLRLPAQVCCLLQPHESWWKTLRSLALAGRFFETWGQIEEAVSRAVDYWNEHRHPYVWGRRRRHRTARKPGVGVMPTVPAVGG